MGKLLIDEPTLQVLPSLATMIGLNEAIVLQQIHWWLSNPKVGTEHDGRKYVRNSIADWQQNSFPWWSESVIIRTLDNLENDGLIMTTDKLNEWRQDRTRWYTVNYEVVEALEAPIERLTAVNQKRKEARAQRGTAQEEGEGIERAIVQDVSMGASLQDVPTKLTNCIPAKVQIVTDNTIEPIIEPTKSVSPTANGAAGKNKKSAERKPNPSYECYEKLKEIQRGIEQGQALRDSKILLEAGFSIDEIVACARWIVTDPWMIENHVALNTAMIVKKIDGWRQSGQPETWQANKPNGNGHVDYFDTALQAMRDRTLADLDPASKYAFNRIGGQSYVRTRTSLNDTKMRRDFNAYRESYINGQSH